MFRLTVLSLIGFLTFQIHAQQYQHVANLNNEDSSYVSATCLNADGELYTASIKNKLRPSNGSHILGRSQFGEPVIRQLDRSYNEIWSFEFLEGRGEVLKMRALPDGGLIASGFFIDTLVVDATTEIYASQYNSNGFVLKLDADGELVWIRSLTPLLNRSNYFNVFDIHDGHIYLPFIEYDEFRRDMKMLELDLDGDSVAAPTFSDDMMFISDLEIDDQGNFTLCGTGGFVADVGGEMLGADTATFPYLSFILKLDSELKQLWSHTYRYVTFDYYPKLALSGDRTAWIVDSMPNPNGIGNHHLIKVYDASGTAIHTDSIGPSFFSRMHYIMDIIDVNDGFLISTLKDFSNIRMVYLDHEFNTNPVTDVELRSFRIYPGFTRNDSVIHYSHSYISQFCKSNGSDSVENTHAVDHYWTDQQMTVRLNYRNKTLGIERATTEAIKIYPIPSTGMITVNVNATQLGRTMQICNLQGQEVYRCDVHQLRSSHDLSHLRAGLYLIEMAGSHYRLIID